MKKLTKKDKRYTEAAIRRAIALCKQGKAGAEVTGLLLEFYDDSGTCIACADLRDLYRKRKPLKGVTKKLRKAIR